ncbi:MAG TPA: hypothetical protein RMH85_17930 [Polyangiaceae bacterium LLY-WYZ-15_(1-7)]|nr:hypothetical protein [Polyangiaceae bacterium LLY-WYZ-15_(1-7)]HJL10385.1 hypothetical protein [Polyangiaceae bacterium LLY-WYZ-15_(1-7)]HJL23578.1 hypothetical protein [Polyangiaceae bacterium LLY-WYZ-15_(1-7)]HJL33683.1 hypothetical protein [Polyangiaceae bacterium LLY-WYZ-15_(1-7)]HJL35746.1 hypothetical protein [Polyangiaceae bacterium LLY-WYZ-15_(1-7)]
MTEPSVPAASPREPEGRFGTFDGVFTPTLLTILGVILFLREGWVVGQVGLLGAFSVILLASAITIATALSLASVATNVRLGPGGPYAIIRRSLGLELGGSVGIPLYLSQACAVAMYVFGFREGWRWIFPEHPALVVDLITFGVILLIAFASATLALRLQFVVMALIVGSLVSALAGAAVRPLEGEIEWWRRASDPLGGTLYWTVFAVFFPAVTGVTAGANMSGELRRPSQAIPLGTLSAVGLATLVYLGVAVWLAIAAPPEELRENYTVLIDRAAWGPLVLAGLLGATFSSALSSLVGAPRILAALADHEVVPFHRRLRGRKGAEPRAALGFTALVVVACLMLRDLNAIAPLITMFFLITYAMINVVVLLEQRLAVVSFRPRFRLPLAVPLFGAVGAVFVMFVVNATFSLVSIALVGLVFGVLSRRHIPPRGGDVRSGLFLTLAEWAARRTRRLPGGQARAWKANLLLPVTNVEVSREQGDLVVDLTVPHGSVSLLGVGGASERASLHERLEAFAGELEAEGAATSVSVLEAGSTPEAIGRAIVHAMQTLESAVMHPNVLFVHSDGSLDPAFAAPLAHARELGLGAVVAVPEPGASTPPRRVRVYVRPQPGLWSVVAVSRHINLHLKVLLAYLLTRRWKGASLELVCAIEDPSWEKAARAYLEELVELTRLPRATTRTVHVGPFEEALDLQAPDDLALIGLSEEVPDAQLVARLRARARGTCLFVRDSGLEDALA